MIRLRNVGKDYTAKNKLQTRALKDISLDIGNRGMVFILGKSGSGKSTLLNILGGLDEVSSGEIFFNGKSFKDFKQVDYNAYRNRCVGFVFQDYNLLGDFDVSGNVALALRLGEKGETKEKTLSALRKVGLGEEYLTRKTQELSGGERQRVAIARAIVKDSELILADEPTGNLDAATGNGIWEIFKEISREKLVIAVSHDRESAEKYADRIIEIADGEIVSDTGKQIDADEGEKVYNAKRCGLPISTCFKMGANNLMQRKVKTVCTALFAICTVFVLLVAQIVSAYSPEKTMAKFIEKNGIDYICVRQGQTHYITEFRYGYILEPSTLQYITQNSTFIKNGEVESSRDILDMGLVFAGEYIEIDDSSYYITLSGLDKLYDSMSSVVEIDGKKEPLVKDFHPAEYLIGKKVGSKNSENLILAGVIDDTRVNPLSKFALFDEYYTEKNAVKKIYSNWYNTDKEYSELTLFLDGAAYSGEMRIEKDFNRSNSAVMTENGMIPSRELELADDEVVFTYEMYCEYFKADPRWSYVSRDLQTVLKMPEQIGKRMDFCFKGYASGETYCEVRSLKFAGIEFYEETPPSSYGNLADEKDTRMFFGEAAFEYVMKRLDKDVEILINLASIKEPEEFLVDFRKYHQGYVSNVGETITDGERIQYFSFVYGFEEDLWTFKIVFLALSVIMALLLLLFVINLISYNVMNRRKEIGILRALGSSNKDLLKIFIFETLIISVITCAVALAAIIGAALGFNHLSAAFYRFSELLEVPYLRVDIFTVLTLLGGAFVLPVAATLLPLIKIAGQKPIEAIKNL